VEKKQIAVDVVPGRLRSRGALESQLSKNVRPGAGSEIGTGDHALYWRKKDSWVLTNVAEHLRVVTGSGGSGDSRFEDLARETALGFFFFLSGAHGDRCAAGVAR